MSAAPSASSAGWAHTGSGRVVYDTGRVQIGLRAGERPDTRRGVDWAATGAATADEERLQAALLRERERPRMDPEDRAVLWATAALTLAIAAAGLLGWLGEAGA